MDMFACFEEVISCTRNLCFGSNNKIIQVVVKISVNCIDVSFGVIITSNEYTYLPYTSTSQSVR